MVWLPSKQVLFAISVLDRVAPPKMAPPNRGSALLPARVLLVTVRAPPQLAMAPPWPEVKETRLPVRVLLVTVIVAPRSSLMAPPLPALADTPLRASVLART